MESKAFLVTLRIPEYVSDAQVEDYIEEAIRAWIGCKDAYDTMHDIDRKY